MSGFNPSLHCCSARLTHFMDLGGHLKGTHSDMCLANLITFQTYKAFLMGISMSYFNANLKKPYTGIPLTSQVSITLLSDHISRLLPTANKSVKQPSTGAFTTVLFFHHY